jgi:hypothetical protein
MLCTAVGPWTVLARCLVTPAWHSATATPMSAFLVMDVLRPCAKQTGTGEHQTARMLLLW